MSELLVKAGFIALAVGLSAVIVHHLLFESRLRGIQKALVDSLKPDEPNPETTVEEDLQRSVEFLSSARSKLHPHEHTDVSVLNSVIDTLTGTIISRRRNQ